MTAYQSERLLGLGMITLVGVLAVLALLRLGEPPARRSDGLLLGYPPERFPLRERTKLVPLLRLAQTQTRLARIYQQLPGHSDAAIWLLVFLGELRQIMDQAYAVAGILAAYGKLEPLERLVEEVTQIEAGLVDQLARQLLAPGGVDNQEPLSARIEALRLCAQQLRRLAPGGPEE